MIIQRVTKNFANAVLLCHENREFHNATGKLISNANCRAANAHVQMLAGLRAGLRANIECTNAQNSMLSAAPMLAPANPTRDEFGRFVGIKGTRERKMRPMLETCPKGRDVTIRAAENGGPFLEF